MAGDQERLDVVIFGASGFTGERVVRQAILKQQQESSFSFGLAGRSIEKLRKVLNRSKQIVGVKDYEVDLLEADIKRPDSLLNMCRRAKVLINCVGPYRFYGEQVVRACLDARTHYVDISGEPQFLEGMQVKYDQEAREKQIYMVSACGFDSIPSELGIAFVKQNFDGDLNSVETYMSFKAGPQGTAVHYTTWESAVHGIASSSELPAIRKKLFTQRFPKAAHKVDMKALKSAEEVEGWAVPFPGSDRSVARRTEYLEFTEQNKKPIQVVSYFKPGSLFNIALLSVFGAIFMLMAKFSFTRDLLLKYPAFFSMGFFHHEGPSEEQIKNTSFRMELVGKGYVHRLSGPEVVHTDEPTKTMVAEVTGPEPGYVACSAMVLECAMTILQETGQSQSRIPRFGVLPPGYAFGNTDIIDRLRPYGIGFKVVSQTA